MLALGHAGITLGAAAIIVGSLSNIHFQKKEKYIRQESSEDNRPERETTGES